MREISANQDIPLSSSERYRLRSGYVFMYPLFVLSVAGLAYLFCLSNHLTQDSVAYVRAAITGNELVHPHHLLYNPLMRIFVLLLTGARIETIVKALQYINMLITLTSVLVVWLVVRGIGAPRWAAVMFSIFFALSAGILAYSSQVEVYNVTVLFLAVAVFGLVHERSTWGPVLVGAGWFTAMLFHQTAVFFGAAVVTHELLQTGRHSFRRLAGMAGLPLLAIGIVYLVVCWFQGCTDVSGCYQWITSYAHTGFWGKGTISYDTISRGFRGMLGALASTRGIHVFFLVSLYVLGNLLANCRHSIENKAIIAACIAWCAFQGIFNMWWFASNSEFWIIAVLPLVLTLAAVAHSGHRCSCCTMLKILVNIPIIIAIILMALSAWDHYQRNSRSNVTMLRVAQCVGIVTSKDTVITADNELRQYCRLYLDSDRVIAMNTQIASRAAQAPGGVSFTQALIAALDTEVRQAHMRGGTVFADQRIIQGTLSRIRLMKDFEPDTFSSDVVRQFKVVPLNIKDAMWSEIGILTDDKDRPAAGLEKGK